VAGSHHPGGAIEYRPEIVRSSQLRLTGGQPHSHRQFERSLRGHRGVDSGTSRGKRGAHTVAGVLEQPTPVAIDGAAQRCVMRGQRYSHSVRVGFPATGRTLDVGK
jgi:hypothetical protein